MTSRPQVLPVQRRFWDLIATGMSASDAGVAAGVSANSGRSWFRQAGGVNPRFKVAQRRTRPRLSHAEREQIMIGTSQGESIGSMSADMKNCPLADMKMPSSGQ